ncbi:MAG: hypothetical protein WA656_20205, partial [Pseudolabrys sp.]
QLNILAQREDSIILNTRFNGICRHRKRGRHKPKGRGCCGERRQLPTAFRSGATTYAEPPMRTRERTLNRH